MTEDVESCLLSAFRKVCERFGTQRLNRQQEEAIRSIVLNKKDVFMNLPTGFGKSMIFQGARRFPVILIFLNICTCKVSFWVDSFNLRYS